ncbi:hypothetical protein [Clostridium paraputrificum]|jgi:hypothetical protein|uniref:hypothetical protein n=1 Tax=Clostridium paraputrificum TaxID=29363 RepID=UPI00374E58B5
MKKVLRINTDGFYIEDVILNPIEEIPSDCIETYCPEGFYKPKWDGEKWVEGYTSEEIKQIQEEVEASREITPYEKLEKENLELKLALAELSEEKDAKILSIELALAEIVEGGLI